MTPSRGGKAFETVSRFWRWWQSELAELWPFGSFASARSTRCDIFIGANEVVLDRVVGTQGERFADARSIQDLDAESWSQLASLAENLDNRVILRPPLSYCFDIELPRAAGRHIKSAISFQLQRLSPIEPEFAVWSLRRVASDKQHVRFHVGLAHAQKITKIAALFGSNGIPAPPFFAEADDQPIRLLAGFHGSSVATTSLNRALSISAGLILSIPLTTLVLAETMIWSTERGIEQLKPEVAPKLEAERRERQAEKVRKALQPVLASDGVSTVAEELSSRLPADAYVEEAHSSMTGSRRVTAVVAEAEPVRTALSRSPLFRQLRIIDQIPEDYQRTRTTFEDERR